MEFFNRIDPKLTVANVRYRAASMICERCVSEGLSYFAAAISVCTASGNPFGNGTFDAA
jgi:hypothetical protein